MPKTLSVNALRDMVLNLRGSKIVTIVARTKADIVGGKKSPMYGLEKVSVVNGMINWSYQNAVNNRRAKECDEGETPEYFEPEARKWGERMHDEVTKKLLSLVKHTPKGETTEVYYLELMVQNSIEYRYYLGGREIPKEEVKPHLRQKEEGRRQEVENPVILRDYRLANIEQITYDGEVFLVA